MRNVTFGLAMIMITCQWQAAASESTAPQQYSIKQSSPSTGSNVKRTIIEAGAIPLDKRYADLTAEQKNILKSGYEQMKDADEPPFPANGLMTILSAVRKAHEQSALQHQGPLTLRSCTN